jgi:hypothetical protein
VTGRAMRCSRGRDIETLRMATDKSVGDSQGAFLFSTHEPVPSGLLFRMETFQRF